MNFIIKSFLVLAATSLVSACKNSFIINAAQQSERSCNAAQLADDVADACSQEPGAAKRNSGNPSPPPGNDDKNADTKRPQIEDGFLSLTAVEIDDGEITLVWNPASDDVTGPADLVYEVYYSLTNNLNTIAQMKANGLGKAKLTGETSHQFSGLTIDKDYYFGVIVRDEAGNEEMYVQRGPFCGGTGVIGDEFEICDPGSLQNIQIDDDKHFRVVNNIDASDSVNWNAGGGFMPISTFSGVLDGGNYSITQLVSVRSLTGLFNEINGAGAKVINLSIRDLKFDGAQKNGGLAAICTQAAEISNVHTSGQITTTTFSSHTGGIVGYSLDCPFTSSSSSANIHSYGTAGGLIGQINSPSTVSFSFATGNVIGSEIGGLVGMLFSASVLDSYATGNVHNLFPTGSNTGGLIGRTQGGTILRNYATGNVFSNNSSAPPGGVFGRNNGSPVQSDNYSAGIVVGDSGYAGGYVGLGGLQTKSFWLSHSLNATDCYTLGPGSGGNSNCTAITNPTWFYDVDNYDGGAGELTWDFSATGAWIMPQTGKYPVLRWQNPNDPIAFPPEFRNGRKIGLNEITANAYRVWGYCSTPGAVISFSGPTPPADTTCNGGTFETYWDFDLSLPEGDVVITVTQAGSPGVTRTLVKDTSSCDGIHDETTAGAIDTRFSGVGPHVVCNVEQMARVQADSTNWSKSFVLGANIDLGSGYTDTPIGLTAVAFTGSFDGNGFFLDRLTIVSASDDKGLFGFALNATIINTGVEQAYVAGADDTGIICGNCQNVTMSDLYSTGFIKANGHRTGGVVGYFTGSSDPIESSFSSADVITSGGSAGGLVGQAARIHASFATGAVRAISGGGLAGYAITVSQSYATGDVSTTTSYAAGLIGSASGVSIVDSYATGDVYGGSASGGLIGVQGVLNDLVLERSYAANQVFATTGDAGGLVGRAASSKTLTVNDSFSVSIVNAPNGAAGGLIGAETLPTQINNSFYASLPTSSTDCLGDDNGNGTSCGSKSINLFSSAAEDPLSSWDFATPIWQFTPGYFLPVLN